MTRHPVISFNAGELSPLIDARSDIDKYRAGCRTLENMIPRIYGPAVRRPGTRYIDPCDGVARVLPFIYSNSIAYILLLENLRMYFYYAGGQVLDTLGRRLKVDTPYLAADLFELQYKQSNDVMWITHGSYQPRKLRRTSANAFSLDAITFTNGPFKTRNDWAVGDGMTMTPSVTAIGANGTLTASAAFFDVGHVGALFTLTQPRVNTEVEGTMTSPTTGVIGTPILVEGSFTFVTHGTWTGKVVLERSIDQTNWEILKPFTSEANANVQYTGTEEEDGIYYRIRVVTLAANTAAGTTDTPSKIEVQLTVNSSCEQGICRVTGYTSTTEVTMTVLKAFASTNADVRWAEGCWSDYRGWPRCVTFFEDRAVYAGTAHQPQTVWFSGTGDFEDFKEDTLDSSSFSLTMSSDTRNAILWISALEALIVGTAGSEWRIRSNGYDEPITPTNYSFKQQTTYGSKAMQALCVNDALLFVDSVGRKVREASYDGNKDKYIARDLSALAEHITETGIVDWGFQKNPDPILWSVRTDGTLLSMTYEREQDVIAWSRHPFAVGSGAEGSVEVPAAANVIPDHRYVHVFSEASISTWNTVDGYAYQNGYGDLGASGTGGFQHTLDVAPNGRCVFGMRTLFPHTGTRRYAALYDPETDTYSWDFFQPDGGWGDATHTAVRTTESIRIDPTGEYVYILVSGVNSSDLPTNFSYYRWWLYKFLLADGSQVWRVTMNAPQGGQQLAIDPNGTIYVYQNISEAVVLWPAAWYIYDADGNYEGSISGQLNTTFCSDIWVDTDIEYDGQTGYLFFAGTTGSNGRVCWRSIDSSTAVTVTPDTLGVGEKFTSICTRGEYVYATSHRLYTGTYYATVWKFSMDGTILAHVDTGNDVSYGVWDWDGHYVIRDDGVPQFKVLSSDTLGTIATYPFWAVSASVHHDEEMGIASRFYGRMSNTPAVDYSASGLGPNSVAVIPSAAEDEVWLVVARVIGGSIVRYLEQMQPRDWGGDQEDCWFLDAALATETPDADGIVRGLGHLEGEEVGIILDGAEMPRQTVTGRQVNCGAPITSKAIVGLPLRYTLQAMRFDLSLAETTKGSLKRFAEVVISFYETLNAQYGTDVDHLFELTWRTTEPYDSPPGLWTGDQIATHEGGFSVEDEFVITGDGVYPCTVRALIPRVELTGR